MPSIVSLAYKTDSAAKKLNFPAGKLSSTEEKDTWDICRWARKAKKKQILGVSSIQGV
jgi:hypothetical protein